MKVTMESKTSVPLLQLCCWKCQMAGKGSRLRVSQKPREAQGMTQVVSEATSASAFISPYDGTVLYEICPKSVILVWWLDNNLFSFTPAFSLSATYSGEALAASFISMIHNRQIQHQRPFFMRSLRHLPEIWVLATGTFRTCFAFIAPYTLLGPNISAAHPARPRAARCQPHDIQLPGVAALVVRVFCRFRMRLDYYKRDGTGPLHLYLTVLLPS